MFALNPDGTSKWRLPFGSVAASPAVGAGNSSTETVYVGGGDAGVNAYLYALVGGDGGTTSKCGSSGTPFAGVLSGAIAVGTADGNEAAVAIANVGNGLFAAISPADAVQCSLVPNADHQTQGNGIVFAGADVFYGDLNGGLLATTFTTVWINKSSWGTSGKLAVGGSGQRVGGPALQGTALGSSVRSFGVVGAQVSDGTKLPNSFPGSGVTVDPGVPTAGAGGQTFVGVTISAGKALLKGSVSNGQFISKSTAAQVTAAPIAGSGDRLYTVDEDGTLQVWTQSDLTEVWSQLLSATVTASPNLSCGLGGAPGTLYIGTETGQLYAIVSDSIGLDSTSPWPKYQHDIRNTGNPSTPLCP
jgi:hypothetical protein